MLTIDEILNIEDDGIRDIISKIYGLTKYGDLSSTFSEDSKYLLDLKNALAMTLYNNLINNDLVTAINGDINYKYKRQIEVVRCLKNNNWIPCSNVILEIDNSKDETENYYTRVTNFIKKQGIVFTNGVDDKIKEFSENPENYIPLYISTISEYYPEDKEIQDLTFLLGMKNNYECGSDMPVTIDQIIDGAKNDAPDELQSKINKKVGNVGEYLVTNLFNSRNSNPTNVAMTCGDGYGFDQHSMLTKAQRGGYDAKEMLIEVKATLSSIDSNDYFLLTETEQKVMKDCLDQKYRQYNVFRPFLDKNNINTSPETNITIGLKPIDEDTFIQINGDREFQYDKTATTTDGGKIYTKRKRES